MQKTLAERFWQKVDKKNSQECWPWKAYKSKKGYGSLWVSNTMRAVHRISWELHKGPIPPDKWVLHNCDNPGCVNPVHLFLGNNSDNVNDKVRKGRQSKGETIACKLQEKDVLTILASDDSGPVLARRFGVNEFHIYRIRRAEKWRYILPKILCNFFAVQNNLKLGSFSL